MKIILITKTKNNTKVNLKHYVNPASFFLENKSYIGGPWTQTRNTINNKEITKIKPSEKNTELKKPEIIIISGFRFCCDPEAIRTLDLLLRRQDFINLVHHKCPVYEIYTGHCHFQFILNYTNKR